MRQFLLSFESIIFICEADFSPFKSSLQFNQAVLYGCWQRQKEREIVRDRERQRDLGGGQPALNVSTLTRYKQTSQMKEISKSYQGREPEPAGYQDGQ